MSAQVMEKIAAPAAAGSGTAGQVCPRLPAGSITPAPPELKSQNGVLETTLKFFTTTDAQGLARYCYVTDTGLQAPTLRVHPGDQLIIHFENDLPVAGNNMAGMKMSLSPRDSGNNACNGSMSASATNIHFHGTNTAPVCGQDEVIHTLIAPGQNFDYKVQIPANEPPGLYWYHPHPHGFSEAQVQGGATGALIVEGLQNVNPALAGLPERTFVLRDQLLPAWESNDENVPAWDLSINYVPVTFPHYTPAVIQTNPGQQELWRVANTGADSILNLQYMVNGTAQPVQVVAVDGYPIASGSSGETSQSETSVLLPPGARAEFVLTTPNMGDQAQLVTQYWNTGPDGDANPARPIANIVSQVGMEATNAPPAARLSSHVVQTRVTRFAALAAATPLAQRDLYFSETLLDPSNPLSPTTFFITQQGQTPTVFTMDQPPNIVVHAGTVEDWVVENRAEEDHVFHIHQIHFQVLEVNRQPVNDPAVRDTVDIPYWTGSGPYPSVKVRMDFRDPNIVGTFVYHCHILEHEDGGMMGEIQVLPSSGLASTATVSASAASVAPNGNVSLAAKVLDASTGAPSPTGSVQFQLNGINLGGPVAISNGQATLSTSINGSSGTNQLAAFYQGDPVYAESTSSILPIEVSSFALTSQGATAAAGSAAIANVTVDVANNYTAPISFACGMPAGLAESACFVNPKTITGSGKVSLTVNTTPAHPGGAAGRPPATLAASGGLTLATFLLAGFPRRRRARAMLLCGCAAIWFTLTGCGGSAAVDPGTSKGTYSVSVTASAGTGSSQFHTSVSVPVTIH